MIRRSRRWTAKCRFYIPLNTRVPHASKRSKTTLLPTYKCTVRTRWLRTLTTILSTMHHAPEAQEGHTPRPWCHHKRTQRGPCSPPTKQDTAPICAARLSGPSRCSRAPERREHDEQ